MERHVERHLEILTAIEEGTPLTQRALAERLGVALGLANLYLKRLRRQGVHQGAGASTSPEDAGKRLRYVLTPKGAAEKARLTYGVHGDLALQLFRRTRGNLRDALEPLTARTG